MIPKGFSYQLKNTIQKKNETGFIHIWIETEEKSGEELINIRVGKQGDKEHAHIGFSHHGIIHFVNPRKQLGSIEDVLMNQKGQVVFSMKKIFNAEFLSGNRADFVIETNREKKTYTIVDAILN